MMTSDPSQHQAVPQFTAFYYELVIFELTATYGYGAHIIFERIADTFNIAAEISEKFPDLLYPCEGVIRANGLDDGLRVRKYLQTHKPTLLCLPSSAPMDIPAFHSPPVTVADALADCCGYRITETGVCLPSWTAADERMFLVQYAKVVPHHYKDDLAVYVNELLSCWNLQGSRGEVAAIREGLPGLIKFSDLNATKRALFEQHEQERCQRVERQKKEAEEMERLEQERRRLETEQERLREVGRVRAEKRELDRARKEQEKLDRARKEQELDRVRKEEETLERAKAAELDSFRKEKELGALEEQQKVRTRDEMIEDRMQELLNTTRATDARKQQVLDLTERLVSGLRTHFQQTDIEVLLFGSFATGLCNQNSDADFSVIDRSRKIKSIDALANALRGLGYTNVVSIPGARVPIATFVDPVDNVQCDISLNTRHGVYNSKLIDAYRRVDDRFMPLWFAIRHLAKKNKILSGRLRFLTSYALVMMMIAFLQAQKKPILPRLQNTGTTTQGPIIEESDYSFDENWSNHTNFGSTNDSSSALLFKEFCRFFGEAQVNFKTFEINPRLGVIRKTRKMQDVNHLKRKNLMDAPICIMDPFILDCNLAKNVLPGNVTRIKKVFADAGAILVNGDIDRLFS